MLSIIIAQLHNFLKMNKHVNPLQTPSRGKEVLKPYDVMPLKCPWIPVRDTETVWERG